MNHVSPSRSRRRRTAIQDEIEQDDTSIETTR